MRMMTTGATTALAVLALVACTPATTTSPRVSPEAKEAAPTKSEPVETSLTKDQLAAATAITRAPAPKPAAKATASQLDTTTAAQKAAAAKAPEVAETRLGSTIASLGDPTEGGFWIKTPLVKARGIGRIFNPVNGKSAKVDLIPLDGPASGGSQVSLPALQLIGVSLTDLPELEVYKS
ncbi:hypothetical protein [Paracoccus seriniphilus]|uniref:D-galactarate dehydratase n=1 Tax=Paracoccus seriniphilus TaxID=184748 RepID=A0A239PWU8_9RHOB|nr:hypothetical protein [Paracoccus seriniphilus]WCR13110.1 hypothetical protein JHW44_09140 [Paracoccus seriniphilus]SNT74650.1 hypothetical protein SAMN05444959_10896 [Paracoccus seriniphilus]